MLPDQLQIPRVHPPDFEWLERNRKSPEKPYGQHVSHEFGVRTDVFDSLRGNYNRLFARRHRAGFPFPCLDGGMWDVIPAKPLKPFGETERVESITAWLLQKSGPTDVIALPLKPLWPGLMANIAAFGCAWWLLRFAPFALRSAWRKRRALCPTCGYNLRGAFDAGCPECGWRRDNQTSSPDPGTSSRTSA